MDALAELDLQDNTYVLFTSDNGPWLIHKADAGTAEPVRFDFPPNPFAGIQLRTIPGEQIQAQLTFVALDRLLDLSGFVRRMTIPDQKDGGFASHHQPVQKAANDLGIQPFLFNHEPHPATPIHGTDHVEAVSRTGASHHRRLPLDAPGRPRMVVTAQARFIGKPDLRAIRGVQKRDFKEAPGTDGAVFLRAPENTVHRLCAFD